MIRPRRTLPLAALALAGSVALIGPAGPAAAAEDPTATVSPVSCVDEAGVLTVTLAAADTRPASFLVLFNGVGGEETVLAAGETQDVTTTSIDDGDYTVEVILLTDGDQEIDDTIALEERAVLCDVAPEGPYTNVRGSIMDSCDGTGWVTASNKAIAGNTEDLQPVTFVLSFTPFDEPIEGDGTDGTDGSDGTEIDPEIDPEIDGRLAAEPERVVDTFVLDAGTQTYDRTFSIEDLGASGELVLRVGEDEVASGFVGICEVLAVPGESGPTLVEAGA